ncbi:tetratricopeptide repeat protein [Bythopirellula goksoeyrii]|uniref:Tetratricopeptide repeat protein n=1 Tax=Bythopirellula goksoeyrii TaxID=1400387 RepID=A0A5B9QFK3_9BACT|nr:tetratricopeptide repeat protein [Bythopirellula goksoeyrii]QEG33033.1 Tetratricopeptide repeat protein [Bythopirellula goksoeyrii]
MRLLHQPVVLLCLSVIAGTFLALPAKAQTGIDRVQRRNGIDSGEIIKTTALGVTISKGGVTSEIPAEEIRIISFAGEPPQFNSIRRAIGRGRFDSAQESLAKLDSNDMVRPEIRQEFQFLNIVCQGNLALAGKGNLKEAIAAVGSFLLDNRTSYHVPEAIELQGDLYLGAGEPATAQKKYETLAKAPAAYYKARSAFLVGQLMQREGVPSGAIEQFDAALEFAKDNPASEELITIASLQRAVSLSATGELEEGLETIKRTIVSAPSDDTQLLAQGYNALGNSYLAVDNPRAARDAFLHVDLLFPDDPDEHAEALYHLAIIWKRMNQPTRAADAEQRLNDEYPMSRWTGR